MNLIVILIRPSLTFSLIVTGLTCFKGFSRYQRWRADNDFVRETYYATRLQRSLYCTDSLST